MTQGYQPAYPTIGVLAGWQFYRTATNLSYLAPVFRGISRAAYALQCNLLFGCGMGASASPADPIRPAWPVSALDVDTIPIGPSNTDALIVFNPLHSEIRSRYIQDLITAGHPVLFIGSGESGPTIAADNEKGIFEAVDHLIQHGHRQIGFIAGSPDDLHGDTGDRLNSFQAVMERRGLRLDPRVVLFGRHVYDGGYEAARQILAADAGITAILASNDEMALGAIQALKDAGRKIPQEIAVIGFDNRSEGLVQEPTLTTIHIPLYEMGYHAVELIHQHLTGKSKLAGTIRIQTRLVIRNSCGCSDWQAKSVQGLAETVVNRSPLHHSNPLVQVISTRILNQAQNFTEYECKLLCRQLVDAFSASLSQNNPDLFERALQDALVKTSLSGDEANIWQDAISLLKIGVENSTSLLPGDTTSALALLEQGRLLISAQMQNQYRQSISKQRWASSRLSLLTAGLQTALDEDSIFAILSRMLPDMEIRKAFIVLFETQSNPNLTETFSLLRSGLSAHSESIRFPSSEFPPQELSANQQPYQLALIPLTDQSGQLGYVVFGTDFFDLYGSIVQQLGGAFNTARLYRQATEGRRLAEESNRLKSRFLSVISHELRTPLNLIVGLSGMILHDNEEKRIPLAESARKDVERILAYSQHLGGLIGDVIDLATSEVGQLRLNLENVNLGQTLMLVSESGRQLAADKGLRWEAHIPSNGPWIRGDKTRLRQIALNLVNNAVKYTSSGSVNLSLRDNGETVTVSVTDTGIGIPLEEQKAIFDEFRQSERSVNRGYGGLGLGLAISKRLIEMHGGNISVQSTGIEGLGSTFSFSLPTVQEPNKTPLLYEERPLEKQRVVLLTNQPGSREMLLKELGQHGFNAEVIHFKPGLEWMAHLLVALPDAIIVDVSTQTELGWEAMKEIKNNPTLSRIPVLLFSSSPKNGSLIELDYLTKPIEISKFSRALDEHWLLAEVPRPIRRILVVDDEPHTLELHARIVQAHSPNNQVLKASTGREALEILRREKVDLILLDLQMPEMDGFEVIESLRQMESTSTIPVIVVTGQDLTDQDMQRLNQGVATVLGKGLFSIEETVAHISSALERKRRLGAEAQRLVRAAMVFLHNHFAEPISRREIAQHVGITEDHLTFCFRQELGTTPIEYLQRYRINQAKRLLRSSSKTITEIALDVGFSDSGYFSRIFHRETGLSPEAFRRS